MTECEFCGENFDSDQDLHAHWKEEHEDELNSHQKDKAKRAKRKKKEQKETKMQKRKQMAGYGLTAVLALAVVAFLGQQVISSMGSSTEAVDIDTSDEPLIGDPNASVEVVEFGDYKCPYCGRFESSVFPQLKENFIDTGDVKFHFVNFAFLDANTPGDSSQTAAVAGECVYEQSNEQFWSFHKAVYENQGSETSDWATPETLMQMARDSTQNLNYEELNSCITNAETLSEVESDFRKGQGAGVLKPGRGTPAVFVNGKYVQDWSYRNLASVIRSELDE